MNYLKILILSVIFTSPAIAQKVSLTDHKQMYALSLEIPHTNYTEIVLNLQSHFDIRVGFGIKFFPLQWDKVKPYYQISYITPLNNTPHSYTEYGLRVKWNSKLHIDVSPRSISYVISF